MSHVHENWQMCVQKDSKPMLCEGLWLCSVWTHYLWWFQQQLKTAGRGRTNEQNGREFSLPPQGDVNSPWKGEQGHCPHLDHLRLISEDHVIVYLTGQQCSGQSPRDRYLVREGVQREEQRTATLTAQRNPRKCSWQANVLSPLPVCSQTDFDFFKGQAYFPLAQSWGPKSQWGTHSVR